jgi:alpha-amylase
MYFRQISGDGEQFGFPFGVTYTLAFSRVLYPQEILVAYNVAGDERHDRVVVDSVLHPDGSTMRFLFGGSGTVPVHTSANGTRFVKLDLEAHQLVILA